MTAWKEGYVLMEEQLLLCTSTSLARIARGNIITDGSTSFPQAALTQAAFLLVQNVLVHVAPNRD